MYDTPVEAIPKSLLCEGITMWRALIDDFAQWADVTTPVDSRLSLPTDGLNATCIPMIPQGLPWPEWMEAAHPCDQVLIVAPETDSLLMQGIAAFRSAGFQVLALTDAALTITSDKWQTAKWLHREGIPHPETWVWDPAGKSIVHSQPLSSAPIASARYEVERFWVKPRDGCGAMGLRCYEQLDQAMDSMQPGEMVQRHAEGRSGSILGIGNGIDSTCDWMPAVWQTIGPRGNATPFGRMEPSTQAPQDEGGWVYQGGCGPVAPAIQRRADILAARVLKSLPGNIGGFVGIDWIVADDPSMDCVIEINPRLTSSYIGVRQIVAENLTQRLVVPSQTPPRSTTQQPTTPPLKKLPRRTAAEFVQWTVNPPTQSLRNHPDRLRHPPNHHPPCSNRTQR
jgi:predicted ATP-grasp superfamily ATP-dependent carboligase